MESNSFKFIQVYQSEISLPSFVIQVEQNG